MNDDRYDDIRRDAIALTIALAENDMPAMTSILGADCDQERLYALAASLAHRAARWIAVAFGMYEGSEEPRYDLAADYLRGQLQPGPHRERERDRGQ